METGLKNSFGNMLWAVYIITVLSGCVYAEAEETAGVDTVSYIQDTIYQELMEKQDGVILYEYDPETGRYMRHTMEALPFGVGERLRYHMDFAFMRAGRSEMMIVGVDSVRARRAYHFKSRVRSTKSVDLIYKVRDVVESWFDVNSLYSHRYERRIREGSYRSQKYFDYNHDTEWVAISNENGPKGLAPFRKFSHNIISALYWVRAMPLAEGKEFFVPLHDHDIQYPLKVVVYGKEEIKVPAGTFTCWKIEPVIHSEGLFKMADRLWVWISDDENRLPVLMKSKIAVGSINGKLVEYRLGFPVESGTMNIQENTNDWDW